MKWFYILITIVIIYLIFWRNVTEHFWGDKDTWNLVPRQFDDYNEMYQQFDESRNLTFIPKCT
jgi:hypothetical protein